MDHQIVHVRINDAATNKPIPVRLRLFADGRHFAPLGRSETFPTEWSVGVGGNLRLDDQAFAYVDGACEVRLPSGPIQVEVSKGLEYVPLRTTVDHKAGQLALRLTMERRFDWAADGWYSGDTQAHFLSPHAAALEGAAEGLHVVNLLASDMQPPDLLHFSGQEPALAKHGCQVVVNTLNDGEALGRLSLLNSHRVVFPLTLGETGFEDYTLADWCQQCHRKGGLVVWPSFPDQPGEALANLILGQIDAIEWTATGQFSTAGLPEWYRLLNLGFRIPLVGGSGKGSNAVPLGAVRTYAQLAAGEEFNYHNWIEAIRAGRTLATRGPLIKLSADGVAEAFSVLPFERLELIRDGNVIGTAVADAKCSARVAVTIDRQLNGWLAARSWSADGLAAHTSPLWLAGAKRQADSALAQPLLQRLDWLSSYAAQRPTGSHQQMHLLETAAKARAALERRIM